MIKAGRTVFEKLMIIASIVAPSKLPINNPPPSAAFQAKPPVINKIPNKSLGKAINERLRRAAQYE